MELRWMAGVLAATLSGMIGCQDSGDMVRPTDGNPTVYTTFYPTQYFAQRIAGDTIAIVCPVPEDADAIFWMPDAATVGDYQQADLIILNGAGFAKWVNRVSLPGDRLVDTAEPLAGELIRFQDSVTHRHGPAGSHSHEGLDGHTWVDPLNAKAQAAVIAAALSKQYPKHATSYQQNFADLALDLDELHTALEGYRDRAADTPLLASHPAYNYVARRYGWNIKNLDLDPQQMPDNESLDEIRTLLKEHPARFILWESAPDPAIAARLEAELELTSVVFSPCELHSAADRDAGLDYLSVMRQNIQNLAQVFGAKVSRTSAAE